MHARALIRVLCCLTSYSLFSLGEGDGSGADWRCPELYENAGGPRPYKRVEFSTQLQQTLLSVDLDTRVQYLLTAMWLIQNLATISLESIDICENPEVYGDTLSKMRMSLRKTAVHHFKMTALFRPYAAQLLEKRSPAKLNVGSSEKRRRLVRSDDSDDDDRAFLYK